MEPVAVPAAHRVAARRVAGVARRGTPEELGRELDRVRGDLRPGRVCVSVVKVDGGHGLRVDAQRPARQVRRADDGVDARIVGREVHLGVEARGVRHEADDAVCAEVRNAHLEALVLQVLKRTGLRSSEVEARHEHLRNGRPGTTHASGEFFDEPASALARHVRNRGSKRRRRRANRIRERFEHDVGLYGALVDQGHGRPPSPGSRLERSVSPLSALSPAVACPARS